MSIVANRWHIPVDCGFASSAGRRMYASHYHSNFLVNPATRPISNRTLVFKLSESWIWLRRTLLVSMSRAECVSARFWCVSLPLGALLSIALMHSRNGSTRTATCLIARVVCATVAFISILTFASIYRLSFVSARVLDGFHTICNARQFRLYIRNLVD